MKAQLVGAFDGIVFKRKEASAKHRFPAFVEMQYFHPFLVAVDAEIVKAEQGIILFAVMLLLYNAVIDGADPVLV
jgi:hypothetical protein